MEKLRSAVKYLFGMNFAHLLVLALVVKAIVADVSYATFLLTIPVLSYEGYKLYLKSKNPSPIQINETIAKRLDAHKEELEAIKSKLKAETLNQNINNPIKRYF